MKHNDEPRCEACDKGKAKRISYRYTHDKKTYLHSRRKFIITGYLYLCDKHLRKWIRP